MKRYDFRVKDGIPGLYRVEDGDYYFAADVEREYIPRPDPEEARKAVDRLAEVASWEGAGDEVAEAKAALLRLMGVA